MLESFTRKWPIRRLAGSLIDIVGCALRTNSMPPYAVIFIGSHFFVTTSIVNGGAWNAPAVKAFEHRTSNEVVASLHRYVN
jgi:hypothetical protein